MLAVQPSRWHPTRLPFLASLALLCGLGLAGQASARRLFCNSNADCHDSKVCDRVTHLCRKPCEIDCRRPEPVCGDDGVTYECGWRDARCHGSRVAHAGACTPPACQADLDCPPFEACHEGTCQGFLCLQNYDPVCGVDGKTYSNACEARLWKVEVAYEGECGSRCTSNDECSDAAVCREGTCQEPCQIQCLRYDPVCGADGVTYGCGAVEAACHGVEVLHPGECPAFCGGIAGFPCPEGSVCIDDPADDCDPDRGGADCGGICVPDSKTAPTPREKLSRLLEALKIWLQRALGSSS